MRRTLAVGVALGVATRLSYDLTVQWSWIAQAGVPWLATSFGCGALVRSPRRGFVHGAAVLVVATLVYYAMLALEGHYGGSPLGLLWLGPSVALGAPFGWLGGLYGAGRARVAAVSVLAGCFAGEGLLFGLLLSHHGRAGTVLLAVAIALPFVLLRGTWERLRGLALSAWVAFAAAVGEAALLVVTRYVH